MTIYKCKVHYQPKEIPTIFYFETMEDCLDFASTRNCVSITTVKKRKEHKVWTSPVLADLCFKNALQDWYDEQLYTR